MHFLERKLLLPRVTSRRNKKIIRYSPCDAGCIFVFVAPSVYGILTMYDYVHEEVG